jgi:hypothetical protein
MTEQGRNDEKSTNEQLWFSQSVLQALVSIAVWMTFGLLLEGFLGYKIPGYLLDQTRRELFRLAHAHGTLLGVLLLAVALVTDRLAITPPRAAQMALRIGVVLLPLGFLLAGIWHYESDPGFAIWLVPPSALLVIFSLVAIALATRSAKK